MKRLNFCCFALVALLAASCDDVDFKNKSVPAAKSGCFSDVCKDETTLNKCEGGSYREEPCGEGKKCSENACVPDTPVDQPCQSDICKDASTLKKCEGGSYREEPCGEGNKCSENACVPDTPVDQPCQSDICKDASTLKKCEGGSYREEPCGEGNKCSENACVPDGPAPQPCQDNDCKDESTVKICSGGLYVEQPCGDDEICESGSCKPTVEKCSYHECESELSESYHACVNGSISAETSRCTDGQACLYGSCVDSFEEGSACDDDEGVGYCTADKRHAVVCNNKHKLAIWTCGDECLVDDDGVVDCPKKARPKPHECEKDYRAQCINDNNQVRLCVDYAIVTWNCYGAICSVDANNTIYCPKSAGVAGLGGIESGGTYGDECNVKKYQEACIDNYYARICDKDGFVRIKPAGDCKISTTNPLKVEYSVPAECDTSDYMPFCINDGKAIGFCAYNSDDLSRGIYKAAACASCKTQADAEACMYQ